MERKWAEDGIIYGDRTGSEIKRAEVVYGVLPTRRLSLHAVAYDGARRRSSSAVGGTSDGLATYGLVAHLRGSDLTNLVLRLLQREQWRLASRRGFYGCKDSMKHRSIFDPVRTQKSEELVQLRFLPHTP